MQVLIVHHEGVLCILLIVKLAPQADQGPYNGEGGKGNAPGRHFSGGVTFGEKKE